MATTNWATIYGTSTGQYPGRRPYVNWRVASQNITANTSRVEVIVGSHALNSTTSGPFSGTVTVNGNATPVSGTVQGGVNGTLSGTLGYTVNHASNGTKSIGISLTGGIAGTVGWPGTNLSSTVTLPTIPRASTVSLPASTPLGTAQTLTITRASSSFTHTLELWDHGVNATAPRRTLATKTTATSLTFTQPLTDASHYANSDTGKFFIRCITYSGTTQLGLTDKVFTTTLPTSVIPTLGSMSVSDSTNGYSVTGAYLQNYSKAKVAVSSPAGIYGSTITGYEIRIAFRTYIVDATLPAQTITLSGSAVPVGVRAIDSRGRKSEEQTAAINVLAYNPPAITNADVVRVNTASPPTQMALGTSIGVKTAGTMSRIYVGSTDKNKLTIQTHYRVLGGSSWIASTTIKSNVVLNGNTSWADSIYTVAKTSGIDVAQAYELRLTVKDVVSTVYYPSQTSGYIIPKSKTALSVGTDGIGAGKVWSQGAIDIEGDIFRNGYGLTRFDDTRSTNEPPSWYQTNFPRSEYREVKQLSTFNVPRPTGAGYGILTTTVPWESYHTQYPPTQKMEISAGGVTWRLWRSAVSATVWGSWYGEGHNVIIVDGVAYKRSGLVATPTTPAFTAYGSTYARTVTVSAPLYPEGYYVEYSSHTTSGFTLVGFASSTHNTVRIIQIGSNDTSAMPNIRWELKPYLINPF